MSADGEHWVLINASPDLRAADRGDAGAASARRPRGSPIAAVVLTGAEIDQVGGPAQPARTRSRSRSCATAATLAAVADNPCSTCWRRIWSSAAQSRPGERVQPRRRLQAELFLVPGKVPLYLEGRRSRHRERKRGECRRRDVRRAARGCVYIPGAAAVTPAMRERMSRADVVLFDGTLFTDDEMIRTGTGDKDRPPHGPHADRRRRRLARGACAALPARRIFIHINNTNPILVDGSPERARGRGGRLGGRPTTAWRSCCDQLLTPGPSWKPRCATSARGAITACTRFIGCCMAGNAPRARCRPGRSTATTIRR